MTSRELADKIGGCEDQEFAIALLNAYVKVEEAKARLETHDIICSSCSVLETGWTNCEYRVQYESSLAAARTELEKVI